MTQKIIETKIQESMNKSFTSSPRGKLSEKKNVKSMLKSMNKLKSKIGIDASQNVELQSMTQRSGNFTSVGNRQAKSLQRGAYNPMHFKRSLPEIIQTKDSTNAAGIVKIDKKCYSCTNQNTMVLNAFKMACLGYFPTNVKYKDEVYSRFTLLVLRAKIINDQWDECKNLVPFDTKNETCIKWDQNMMGTLDEIIHFKVEKPDMATTTFDIQPEMAVSFGDDQTQNRYSQNQDYLMTPKMREHMNRTEMVNRVFEHDLAKQVHSSKGKQNFYCNGENSEQKEYQHVLKTNKQGHIY